MPEQYVDFIKSGSASIFSDNENPDSFGMHGLGGILNKIMQKVQGPGMFNFMDDNGSKPVMVIKIKSVAGPGEGGGLGRMLGIGKGGLMHDVSDSEAMPSSMPESDITGSLDCKSPDDLLDGDEILPRDGNEYLEPITVSKTLDLPFGKAILGETKQSGDTFVGIILSKFNKNKLAADYSALLPKNVTPTILSPNVKLYKIASEHNEGIIKTAKECMRSLASNANLVTAYYRDGNTIAIKTAKENIVCSKDALPYYLSSFGIKKADISEAQDLLDNQSKASFITPKRVSTKLSNSLVRKLNKVSWVKVAAYLDSEESVDSALALDYIDGDSVSEFYDEIPVYKKALASMAKLMASVRLGNDIVGEETLKTAMKALDALITELTVYREGA